MSCIHAYARPNTSSIALPSLLPSDNCLMSFLFGELSLSAEGSPDIPLILMVH